ncbi:hypothetical protein Taro_041565 [Colocasia esculenta]|uniref:Uncharacterized protein n=1 Tax=Colocasia esculenta TaxID=4460 RepID=A0A843WG70_COLES|nr:hypothetical protein [Colocasia esculenta]
MEENRDGLAPLSDSPPARRRGRKPRGGRGGGGGGGGGRGSQHAGGQPRPPDPGWAAVPLPFPQQTHHQHQQPQQLRPPLLPRPQFQFRPQQPHQPLPPLLPRPRFQFRPQQPQFQEQPQPQQPLPLQPQFQFQPPQPPPQEPSDPRSAGMVFPFPQQPRFQFPPQIAFQGMQHQPMLLFKVDKSPASYNTKWEELHPDSQRCLLQIEERILEYRSESQRLDQCARLSDSSVANKEFELNVARIVQELRGMSIAIDKQKFVVNELITSARDMMRDTDFAIRSILAYDSYIGVPKRPSQFLTKAVGEFEQRLAECQQWVEKAEESLHLDTQSAFSSSERTSLDSLRSVLSNMHDYFISTAAKVENLHQSIESVKTAYLACKRRQGDRNDPFLEANRQETAKRQTADRNVHLALHLPVISSQPSSEAAGMITNPASLGATSISGGAPGSCFSLFGTAASTLASVYASSSSLFSAPTSSVPASSLFNLSAIAPQFITLGSTQPSSSSASASSSTHFLAPTSSAPTSSLFNSSVIAPQLTISGSTKPSSSSVVSSPTLTPMPAIGSSPQFSTSPSASEMPEITKVPFSCTQPTQTIS